MAAGDLITQDVQAELNALLVGRGTSYVIKQFNPWIFPRVRTDDRDRAQVHGLYGGRDLLGERRVPLELLVDTTSKTAALAARALLAQAFTPASADAALVWQEDGVKYQLFGRPRLADPDITELASGALEVSCRFQANDPRIYSQVALSQSTGLAVAGTGLTFNATPNFSFGGAASGGFITALNAGNFPAPWTAQIIGPVTDPRIQLASTGQTLIMVGTVASGDVLNIDSLAKSILLNGTASRFSFLQPGSAWFDLAPGSNQIGFSATSGSGTLAVGWRSAWL